MSDICRAEGGTTPLHPFGFRGVPAEKENMVETPTLKEMLEAGVHFGHKTSRWHPKMAPYIFASKSGVHVINLERTQEKLREALLYLAKVASEGKKVVFVGTKKQAGEIVKSAAENCDMPYVTERWLGGTLTNFSVVQRAIKKLERMKIQASGPDIETLKKRDRVKLLQAIEKSEKLVGGLVRLTELPEALILIGAHDEKNAAAEAKAAGIKIVALLDTNANPSEVDFPIPANDDATKSIAMFVKLFADTIKKNKTLKVVPKDIAEKKPETEKSK
jgi:small subunit ribosomal protein S2